MKSDLCDLSKEAFKTQVHPTLSCLFSLHMDVFAFPLSFTHTHTHTHTYTHTYMLWLMMNMMFGRNHRRNQSVTTPSCFYTDNLVLPPVHVHFQHVVSHRSVSSCVTISRIARFSNVQHLSIHISKNFGSESTRVYYIGLRGEYSEVQCLKRNY